MSIWKCVKCGDIDKRHYIEKCMRCGGKMAPDDAVAFEIWAEASAEKQPKNKKAKRSKED